MSSHPRHAALGAALGAALALVASPAHAIPKTSQIEGALLAGAGAPAADGAYALTFALYAAQSGGAALWSEGPVQVQVQGGRFTHALGAVKALDVATLAGGDRWLGVQVGQDPELPRQALRAAPYALAAASAAALSCAGCVGGDQLANGAIAAAKLGFNYAGSSGKGGPALDLACTGCVSVGELVFDGDLDLGGNSLKGANAVFTGDLSAKSVTATTFVGDGSKLTGLTKVAGSCKAGQVMVGVASDGSVQCAAGADGNKVLGGLLSSEFTEKPAVEALPLAIPDKTGGEAVVIATFGKVGLANSLAIQIEIENTDLSNVSIKLLPPDDKAKGLTICDPCGGLDAKSYKATLTQDSQLKEGSLKSYIGKPVDGTWTLKVLDVSFCIVQAPGNATLCKPADKTDGAILTFDIEAKVTSSVSVGAAGSLQFAPLDKPPVTCQPAKVGHAYFDTTVAKLVYCDGAQWRRVYGLCGNGVVEAGEACDDGNGVETDGCTSACVVQAEASCAAILSKQPGAKSGWYTIDRDGAGPQAAQRVVCDMTSEGGGWTRFLYHSDPDGRTPISVATWDEGVAMAARGGIKQWLIKTYVEPGKATDAGSAPTNAWIANLAGGVQGAGFTFFKHTTRLAYNAHRYSGTSWVDSAKLLPGSQCKAWDGNAGRHLWGEHQWADNHSTGWMWMMQCANPGYHMLIVNHDYHYGANGRHQTLVGTNTSPSGQHSGYDEDGGAYEFFYR